MNVGAAADQSFEALGMHMTYYNKASSRRSSLSARLRLTSQLHSVTVLWLVLNYTVCEQLAQSCYVKVEWSKVKPTTSCS